MAESPVEALTHPADLEREVLLRQELGAISRPVLAFSGGVDSSYLLAVLAEAIPRGRVAAVLGVSPSLAARQRTQAHEVATGLGITITELSTAEVSREEYQRNTGDRCYFCKDTLYRALRLHFPEATLLDGTNLDDLDEHRPGRAAAREQGVRSPLVDVGLRKDAIRRLSKRRGLVTAELPATPCLASRFPAGVRVSEAGLRQVEAAEDVLHAAGFAAFRVRHHGDLARLELQPHDLARLLDPELRARIESALRALGFRFVAADLGGYRSGSGSTPTAASRPAPRTDPAAP